MPRRRRGSSSLLILLLLLILIPVAAAGAAYLLIDLNSFKPRIVDAVRTATGRELSLAGPISIGLAVSPTVRARDVSLANPPGFSRPQMATLGDVEAQLALWPLLRGRIEIVRLVLTRPDLMLETDANGQGNWTQQPRASAAPTRPSAEPTPAAPRFAVQSIRVTDGTLTWRDGRTGQARVVTIRQFAADSAGVDAPISARADLTTEGHDVALTAETGPIAQLTGAPASPGWPLQIVARVEGTRLAASGTIERPLEGRGYQLTLDAAVPDLTPVGRLLGQALPALRDVSGSARLSDATGGPVLSALALRAGPSDLRATWPGLSIDRIELAAAGLDAPGHAEIEAVLAATKLHLAGSFGAASALLPGPGTLESFPMDLSLDAAGATLKAVGGLTKTGADLTLTARIPDLAALSPLAGMSLPPIRGIALDGRLAGLSSGQSLTLNGFTLSAPQGDIGGDLVIGLRPKPSLRGTLAGKRLDVDALQALLPPPAPTASSPPAVTPSPAVPSPSAPAAPRRLISDQPLNLAAFDIADIDLQASLGELRAGGFSTRDLSGHLVVNQGRITLDPFSATLPGGRLDLRLSAATRDPEPPMSLAVNAPGLALKPLLTALNLPDDVTGSVELAADVTATGRTPRTLAATLSGRIGLLMTEGELDNRLLGAILGDALRAARPADTSLAAGRTKLRCLATRIDAASGLATVASLVLDSSRVLLQGQGTLNLADEAIALRLRPLLRTGGPGIVLPVRVGGTLAAPKPTMDAGGALEGMAAGLLSAGRNPMIAAERGGDACGPALALARGARPTAKSTP